MLTERTVSEILEWKEDRKEIEDLKAAGAMVIDDSFEEAEPYTVKLEEMLWKEIEKGGLNPQDYPDKTLAEILDFMKRGEWGDSSKEQD